MIIFKDCQNIWSTEGVQCACISGSLSTRLFQISQHRGSGILSSSQKKSPKKVYEPDSLPSQQQTLVLLRFKIKGGTVDAIPMEKESSINHICRRHTTLDLWGLDHQEKHDPSEHHRRNRAPEIEFKGSVMSLAKNLISCTSVLRIPNLKSVFLVILSFSSASLTVSTKLGHPDPESNFFLLEKRAVPQQTQL